MGCPLEKSFGIWFLIRVLKKTSNYLGNLAFSRL
jgi:hypothetical protein